MISCTFFNAQHCSKTHCAQYHLQDLSLIEISLRCDIPLLNQEGKSNIKGNAGMHFSKIATHQLDISHFSTQSPCISLHLVKQSTSLLIPSQ